MNKNFDTFGVMLDCSRNAVPNIPFLKQYIDDIALMGYNSLQLYTEETYEIDGEPFFGYLRGRFTKDELKEINAYGKTKGVELVPCIQTLAHLGCLVKWYPYNEFTDCSNILLIDDDRTYALIEKMFATMRECFDSKYINIGIYLACAVIAAFAFQSIRKFFVYIEFYRYGGPFMLLILLGLWITTEIVARRGRIKTCLFLFIGG